MAVSRQTPESVDVGERLRILREQRGLSQRALAAASDLSPNALSQIERGNVSPSVSTLNRLAAALGVPITAFFEVVNQRRMVVFQKAGQRTRIPFVNGTMEGLGGEHFIGKVEAFYLTLQPDGSSGSHPVIHQGHEFVFCIEGLLEYTVEDETYLLEGGDNLLFAARLNHAWRNPGSVETHAIIVIMGFTESGLNG
jgi:transcriptional regulator with XRE-family HTH domain